MQMKIWKNSFLREQIIPSWHLNVIPFDASACNSFNIWEQGLLQKVQVVWNQGMAVHQFAGLTEPLSSQGLNFVFGFKLAEVHDLKLSFLE